MKFEELQAIVDQKLGIARLADIARELDVTPQVVNNWKTRGQVPYKYVKILNSKIKKIEESKFDLRRQDNNYKGKYYNFSEVFFVNSENISLLEILIAIYKHFINNYKKILVLTFISIFFIYIKSNYVDEKVFISKSTILPRNNQGMGSGVSTIASQFGVSLANAPVELSSAAMYPDIIMSRTLIKKILEHEFYTNRFKTSHPLWSILLYDDGFVNTNSKRDTLVSISRAVNRFKKIISVRSDIETSLVTINISTFEPDLASSIGESIIEELDNILKGFRLKRNTEKRNFIDARMIEIKLDLKELEEKLKIFRDQNRNIRQSPALLLEENRISREVNVQTQIYITLKQESELAQIEEVENSSMFSILDSPSVPLARSNTINIFMYIFYGITFAGISTMCFIIEFWVRKNWSTFFKPLIFEKL